MTIPASAAPHRAAPVRRFVAAVLSFALATVALVGLAVPAAQAATVLSAVFSGTNNTAAVGNVMYAKTEGRLTLTVNTTTDIRCVQMGGAHTGRQTSTGPKAVWNFTVVAGSGEGVRTVTLVAATSFNSVTQQCGTNSGSGQASYVLDNTGPVATPALVPAPNAAGWNKDETAVEWTAEDAGAGVPEQPYETDVVGADGVHTVTTLGGADRLGNVGPGASATVRIDRTAPLVTATRRWAGGGITVTFSCTDPGTQASGIDTCVADGETTTSRTVTDGETESVTGTATDVAGNTTTLAVDVTDVDTTPPVLSGAPAGEPAGGGWYSADVPVHWTASDPESGIVEEPADTAITGEGENLTGSATVTNGAGLSTTATSAPAVRIDRTPPATSLTGATDAWVGNAVTITLAATDNLSGVASTTYRVDGGPARTGADVELSDEGDHTVTFFSTDIAGNAEAPQTARVRIDRTAPSVRHLFTPDAYENGAWTNADTVTVAFVCDDRGGSGLASCSGPATVADEGSETVEGTATDGAGNRATDRATVRIDRTAPQVAGTVVGTRNDAGWYAGDVRVVWTATDSLSGVTGTSAATDLGEGTDQTATGTATDAAGNRGTAVVDGIDVDRTAPVLDAAVDTAWSTEDVPVDWSCADALSGVRTAPARGLVTGEGGDLSATATCTDVAGNTAGETVRGIRIDRTPPVTAAEVDGGDAGWSTADVEIGLEATDNLSGVRTVTYTVDGGAPQTYDGPFGLTGNGEHTVSFWSTDVAGNVERAGAPLTVRIDNEAPRTDLVAPVATGDAWLVDGAVPFAFSAADGAGSGVAATYYAVDGGDPQRYGQAVMKDLTSGAHTVRYWSVDLAGNVEEPRAFTVRIDTEGPVVTSVVDGIRGLAGWWTGPVTVTFTCTDALSGVADCPAPQTFDTDGVHSAAGTATDAAGNRTTVTAPGIRIDTAAPSTALGAPEMPDSDWFTSGVPISFKATDGQGDVSGVARTTYRIDDEPAQEYSAPFTADLADGTHTLTYWSVDVAGNVEAPHELTLDVDATAPTITGAQSGAVGGGGWYTGAVTVTFTCTDATSDIATCSEPTTLEDDGTHQVTGTATDAAGNRSSATVSAIRIDTVAPTARFNAVLGIVPSGSVPPAPSCTAVDGGSGPGSCAVTGYSTAVGTHTLTATATDVAGNTGTATQTYTVTASSLTARGFYSPIDMDELNVVKGGSTVPVKFELFDGRRELTAVSDVRSVTFRQVSCTTGTAFSAEKAVDSTGKALKHASQFHLNWKTPTALGCYRLVMTARDGATISALFKVK